MNPDLDTLATRLYVTIDDLLIAHPQWAPERPAIGITPKLTDAELLTLAVIQALLGFTSEARFIRHAGEPLHDVQQAASHADPRTTTRYDRGRGSLDRHATYIVATFVAGASR